MNLELISFKPNSRSPHTNEISLEKAVSMCTKDNCSSIRPFSLTCISTRRHEEKTSTVPELLVI